MTYSDATSRFYGRKVLAATVNGVKVLPVIRQDNVEVEEESIRPPLTLGRLTLMILGQGEEETVANVNTIYGPTNGALEGTVIGCENMIGSDLFNEWGITSNNQLVLVDASDQLCHAQSSGIQIDAQAGFAEQYFI